MKVDCKKKVCLEIPSLVQKNSIDQENEEEIFEEIFIQLPIL